MIRFSCPSCRKTLKSPEGSAGRRAACPRCGLKLLVPPPARHQTGAQNRALLDLSLPESSSGVSVPRSNVPNWANELGDVYVQVGCPDCGAAFAVPERGFGRWIECPQCRFGFVVTAAGEAAAPGPPPAPDAPAGVVIHRQRTLDIERLDEPPSESLSEDLEGEVPSKRSVVVLIALAMVTGALAVVLFAGGVSLFRPFENGSQTAAHEGSLVFAVFLAVASGIFLIAALIDWSTRRPPIPRSTRAEADTSEEGGAMAGLAGLAALLLVFGGKGDGVWVKGHWRRRPRS